MACSCAPTPATEWNLPYPMLSWFDLPDPCDLSLLGVGDGGHQPGRGSMVERIPRLKVLFCEAGCSWYPYWIDQMDKHYENLPEEELNGLKMKPSEYCARQCWVTCEADK